jgi:drug/metabolite transporter (DMT)-like permease
MNGTTPSQSAGKRSQWSALGLLAVLIFAWGGNYTWIKIALSDIGPWTFNAVRYCGAAAIVGVALLLRYGPRDVLPVRGERARLAGIGLLSGAALTMLITASLMWIESTHTILLIYTNPIWTLLLSVFILGERLTILNIAGVIFGVMGIVLLTNPWVLHWQVSTMPGVVAALIGAMAWALGSVLYRRGSWKSTFWQQVFWQLAASGLLTGAAALFFERESTISPSPQLVIIMIYNILIPTALAFWCWSRALSSMKASTASQVLLLSPIFGVAQSHLVLGEPLNQAILESAGCVVTGACLTFLQPDARRKQLQASPRRC